MPSELREWRKEEIKALKQRCEELSGKNEWLASLKRPSSSDSAEDPPGESKRIKRKKVKSKEKPTEPTQEQARLWAHAGSNLHDFCFTSLRSVEEGSERRWKRFWELDVAALPAEAPASDGERSSEGDDAASSDRKGFGSSILTTIDGEGAAPKRPMEAAMSGNFCSTEIEESSLAWLFISAHRKSEWLREKHPHFDKRVGVANDIASIKLGRRKKMIASMLSGRKKEAVDCLLRSLDCPALNDISAKRRDRAKEREKAEKKLLEIVDALPQKKADESGRAAPAFHAHRTPTFEGIVAPASAIEEIECPEEALTGKNEPDALFGNNAAKKTCLIWAKYAAEDASSILELARLDAWAYAWIETTKERIEEGSSGKVGGVDNRSRNKRFDEHLPIALEEILRACRQQLEMARPSELRKPPHAGSVMQEGSMSGPEEECIDMTPRDKRPGDMHNRSGRCSAAAFLHPTNRHDYLAIKPTFFKASICPWIGDALRCCIGRCKMDETDHEEIAQAAFLRAEQEEKTRDQEHWPEAERA